MKPNMDKLMKELFDYYGVNEILVNLNEHCKNHYNKVAKRGTAYKEEWIGTIETLKEVIAEIDRIWNY